MLWLKKKPHTLKRGCTLEVIGYQSYLHACCVSSAATGKSSLLSLVCSLTKKFATQTGANFLQERHCSSHLQNIWLWDWRVSVVSAFFNTERVWLSFLCPAWITFAKWSKVQTVLSFAPTEAEHSATLHPLTAVNLKIFTVFCAQWLQLDTLTNALTKSFKLSWTVTAL